ncbi:hypothetical protein [Synechococcus sp. BIOS-U3-1]|uniref:hypothetical protein n=1 Tax=Synechococcus sp. BIOS-U3-1 TaxID=1400865 RepID=UPI0016465237|nr:hypothetical protein [Synechococcus sp. BIOS-U3-1]
MRNQIFQASVRKHDLSLSLSFFVEPGSVAVVARGLLGSVSTPEGATQEQLRLIQSLLDNLWNRPDLKIHTLGPINSLELAVTVKDQSTRRVFHNLQMMLELCRHPQTKEQLRLGENYSESLGVTSDALQVTRDYLHSGVKKAAEDANRIFNKYLPSRSEPELAGQDLSTIDNLQNLAKRIESFSDLPETSLGWALIFYYKHFGFPVPGSQLCALNSLYVAHDMTHVISGISITPAGEIALSAFQLAMGPNQINESALLASLITHEAGFVSVNPTLHPDDASLDNSSAAHLLSSELARGSCCNGDFSLVDHFQLAHLPLSTVREQFNVLPPINPDDGHHFLW